MDGKKKISKVLTIKDLWELFVQRVWIVAVAAVISVSAFWLYDYLTFVPKYESVATLYIMRENDEGSAAEEIQEYNLAIWGLNDYDYMLKSRKVLSQVSAELKNTGVSAGTSYSALRKSISVTNPKDTRILEVKVVSDTPENAKKTVDVLCDIGVDTITDVMNSEGQVTIFEEGTLNSAPCNRKGALLYVLVGLLAAISVYLVFVIAFVWDDRIKSNEEIEGYLSLSILGDIPEAKDSAGWKYGYRYKGRSYKYYGKQKRYQANDSLADKKGDK